jgi:hypothetical protein
MSAYYVIIDTRTGQTVGKAATLKAARQSVDRRDNAFGGYRFAYKRIEVAA